MEPPPADSVAERVAAALDLANRAPAPAIARAGWLGFTMLSIHPFADGNGRTARMMIQALASEDLEVGVDWGLAEQFAQHRPRYIDALVAGQHMANYDPARLDPAPFMSLTLECSERGGRLLSERLSALIAEHDRLRLVGWAHPHAVVWLGIETLGPLSRSDLTALGLVDEQCAQAVDELVAAGLLRWAPTPASRRPLDGGPSHLLGRAPQ